MSIDVVSISQSDSELIRRICLFDVLVNNGDRKFGHILPISHSEIRGCDHGVTFNVENKLRTVLWQWAGLPFTPEERQKNERFKNGISDAAFAKLSYEDKRSYLDIYPTINRPITSSQFADLPDDLKTSNELFNEDEE